jgi:hypothetical protein
MRKLPADEPPSRVLPDVVGSLRRGFRARLVGLLATSVLLVGSTAAATVAATTVADRLLTAPTPPQPNAAASPSSAPAPNSAGAPQPGMASIRVKLLPYTRTAAGGVREQGQYAIVSGHPDPAVQQRINGVLHEPVDRPHPVAGNVGASGATLATDAKVTLQTPRLLSVDYVFYPVASPQDPSGGNWVKNFYRSESVIVDLDDGRRLGAGDLFRHETLTPTGLQTLVERLMAAKQSPTARSCLKMLRPEGRVELGKQIVNNPPALRLYPRHLKLRLYPGSTLPLVCSPVDVEVPYGKIADLMRPDARTWVRR